MTAYTDPTRKRKAIRAPRTGTSSISMRRLEPSKAKGIRECRAPRSAA